MESVLIHVFGTPKPGGSKRAFIVRTKTGQQRAVITDACKGNKDWRSAVREAAIQAMDGRPLLDGPLTMEIEFHVLRPKGDFKSGDRSRELTKKARSYPTVKPDVTKLVRSTEDALTGIVWVDDCQIYDQRAIKVYGPQPGAIITIREMNHA